MLYADLTLSTKYIDYKFAGGQVLYILHSGMQLS